MREAEERRYRGPAAHIEQVPHECPTPTRSPSREVGAPASHPPNIGAIRVGGAHGTSPSPMRNTNEAVSSTHCPLISPSVSQMSWNPPYDPYCPSSSASTSTSELAESPDLPPFDSGESLPFPRLPSLEELTLPQPPMDTALGAHPFDSGFMIKEGLFHSGAGSSPDDASQGGMSNHTAAWSDNWLGYDTPDEQGDSPNVDAEGEPDFGDLLGDTRARLEAHAHTRAHGRGAAQENVSASILWSSRTPCDGRSPIISAVAGACSLPGSLRF